jgi:hypothetical protein
VTDVALLDGVVACETAVPEVAGPEEAPEREVPALEVPAETAGVTEPAALATVDETGAVAWDTVDVAGGPLGRPHPARR